MIGFDVTLINVLMMIGFMLPGFIISKMKKTTVEHLPTLSSVLVYICSPCLMFTSILAIECNKQNVLDMLLFFVVAVVLQGGFMLVVYLIGFKKREDGKMRFFTVKNGEKSHTLKRK
jgi:predicted permease